MTVIQSVIQIACIRKWTQINFYPKNGLVDEKTKGWQYLFLTIIIKMHPACDTSHMYAAVIIGIDFVSI